MDDDSCIFKLTMVYTNGTYTSFYEVYKLGGICIYGHSQNTNET